MKFSLDSTHFTDIDSAEGGCFLITNGLGGYSCLDLACGTSRNDHAIFMAAVKAPNVRFNMITNVLVDITIDGDKYTLTTQRMSDDTYAHGYSFIENVSYENNSFSITYAIGNVRLILDIIMVHGENTVMLDYRIINPDRHDIALTLTPLLRFTPKNTPLNADTVFTIESYGGSGCFAVCSGSYRVFCATTMGMNPLPANEHYSMRWTLDTRDGRDDTGLCAVNHRLVCNTSDSEKEHVIIYSLNENTISGAVECGSLTDAFHAAALSENKRINTLIDDSGLKSGLGRQLAASADAYVVDRESTNGKTIIAGYPFFEDWGRDTMIALGGTVLSTNRFADCKSILMTFAKYEKNGLLPNLFPEGGATPMYNSADAPLLFINAVYEYVNASGDTDFIKECFTPMKNITDAYENGTDFHIKCDTDGLIMAGDDLEQLTWMDVRVDNFLPTPRHGKPVEINAYWYSALRAMESFCRTMDNTSLAAKYSGMAARTKEAFLSKFYDKNIGCLKDVLNGTYEENQIRCNQIWTLTMPFTMPDFDIAEQILDTVESRLCTTVGLRTLDMADPAFKPIYIGDMHKRDRAYHQGTVWTFPLGAYLRGRIRQLGFYSEEKRSHEVIRLKDAFDALTPWLYEGCLGQFAEIYDGASPCVSRGCFAQAWSVGEILCAVRDWEDTPYSHL